MQIATGTTSHRSIHTATKQIISDVVGDINGTPDFMIVAYTPNYREKAEYEKALAKICEESGTQNIIGGTFPAVVTSNEIPTTQGCAVMAFKSSELNVSPPVSYSNIRLNPNKGADKLVNLFKEDQKKNKTGFFLTPGPNFPPDAFDGMKMLDMIFAHKFRGMFNQVGKLINRNMGKNGYGVTSFAYKILKKLLENGVSNTLGGATIDLDMLSCYQFQGSSVFRNAMVGTMFSSDKLDFGHSWTFDKSQKSKKFEISNGLKSSGYVHTINDKPSKEEFLNVIDIPEELYNEAFKGMAYASLLYLSTLKSEDQGNLPFVSVCHPILDGVIATIPEEILDKSDRIAEFCTQSGIGVQKSAYQCAKSASQGIDNPAFGLFINCSNRLLIAGDKTEQENKMISEALGTDIPFMTLYSGGEFSVINHKPVYAAVSVHGMVAGHSKSPQKNVVF
ncbi:MAG: FIST N-terminal domain-containing protein [Candidatus Heimdallarchaeaceae archaeon]